MSKDQGGAPMRCAAESRQRLELSRKACSASGWKKKLKKRRA
jgi:hypothetical protein